MRGTTQDTDDPTYILSSALGEELSPLVEPVHAAGSHATTFDNKWFRSASLGALMFLVLLAVCINHGIFRPHPNAPNEPYVIRNHTQLAAEVHTNGLVQFNIAGNSIEGNDEGEGGKADGVGKDDRDSADTDNGDGTPTQVPPSMHVVHRDFSKDCGPPQFHCISVRTEQIPALQKGSALIKVSGSAINE